MIIQSRLECSKPFCAFWLAVILKFFGVHPRKSFKISVYVDLGLILFTYIRRVFTGEFVVSFCLSLLVWCGAELFFRERFPSTSTACSSPAQSCLILNSQREKLTELFLWQKSLRLVHASVKLSFFKPCVLLHCDRKLVEALVAFSHANIKLLEGCFHIGKNGEDFLSGLRP